MMKGWQLITFYTRNTPYEQIVDRLRKSCTKLGISLKEYAVDSDRDWAKNCQKKAQIISQAMEEFPDKNIVYTDADSIIIKYPKLFDELGMFDIAYYYMEHRKEILSGTMFIGNNEKMRGLVSKWINVNSTNRLWDQINLQQVIESNRNDVNLNEFLLPEEMCFIYDSIQQKERMQGNPIIVHFQASRLMRGMILNNINKNVRLPGWEIDYSTVS